MAADAIYKAVLAEKLMNLGYEIELTHPDGRFEIANIDREHILHFSQRRQQIEERLDEMQKSSAAAAEVAALDTRQDKVEVKRSVLMNDWRERAESIGLELRIPEGGRRVLVEDIHSRKREAERLARMSAEHFSERSSVINYSDMMRFGMERGTGVTSFEQYEKEIQNMRSRGELIDVGHELYTTREAIELERKILDISGRNKGVVSQIMSRDEVAMKLDEVESLKMTRDEPIFTKGQKEAISEILTTKDRIVGVQGYAGTGKTTMLSTVRELAEESGYQIKGFSSAATAANLLEEGTMIKSDTLESHLLEGWSRTSNDGLDELVGEHGCLKAWYAWEMAEGNPDEAASMLERGSFIEKDLESWSAGRAEANRITLGDNWSIRNCREAGYKSWAIDVVQSMRHHGYEPDGSTLDRESRMILIVDEVSMMGNVQAEKLLRMAELQGARLVLVGDVKQLPSIPAGKPFEILQNRGVMATAEMKKIIRQDNDTVKKAVVEAIHGKSRDSVRTLRESIIEIDNRNDRLKATADKYLDGDGQLENRPLVVAGTNRDSKAINRHIRDGLKEKGYLQGIEVNSEVLSSLSYTKVELKDARSYRTGNVIRFQRDYKRLGVGKGEYAQVESVCLDTNTVYLKKDDGTIAEWKPSKNAKIEAFNVENRGLQAGDRIRWTRNDKRRGRRNREIADVISVDPINRTAQIQTSTEIQTLDHKREKHWEHGYASTVHAAQGKTKDSVIVYVDTMVRNVVGEEAWYVAISRAKNLLIVFTDDKENLPEAVSRAMGQESALEAVECYTEKMLGFHEKSLLDPMHDLDVVDEGKSAGILGLGKSF
jgi:ATP-dependent exoDNAse (exonuclease V) alpha subunit